MKRVLVGALVVGALFLVLLPRAQAMVDGDPWVPPSVATSDGLAVSTVLVGNAAVSPLGHDPADVRTYGDNGYFCNRGFPSWAWLDGTVTIQVASDRGGAASEYCTAQGWSTWGAASMGCLVISAYDDELSNVHLVPGDLVERSEQWMTRNSSSTAVIFSALQCEFPEHEIAAYVRFDAISGSFSQDGLMTYIPGVIAAHGLNLVVTTTCSDASTVTASFAAGVAVVAPECVTGSRVSVAFTSGGFAVGSSSVTPDFVGNPCLEGIGACNVEVTAGGVTCDNTDPSCVWWGTNNTADSCRWVTDPTGDGWLIPDSDCEAARSDGYDVPGGLNGGGTPPPTTLTPDPTATPTVTVSPSPTTGPGSGPTTINVNVTVQPVQPANNPAGGCLAESVTWNPSSWVLEPIRCAFTPSNYRIGGVADVFTVCAADPTHNGAIKCTNTSGDGCPPNTSGIPIMGHGEQGWEAKCYDGKWNEWQQAWTDFINAWMPGAGSQSCSGPSYNLPMIHHGTHGLTIENDFVIHPFQACEEPGRTYAAMSMVCMRALIMIGAFVASWDTIRKLVKA